MHSQQLKNVTLQSIGRGNSSSTQLLNQAVFIISKGLKNLQSFFIILTRRVLQICVTMQSFQRTFYLFIISLALIIYFQQKSQKPQSLNINGISTRPDLLSFHLFDQLFGNFSTGNRSRKTFDVHKLVHSIGSDNREDATSQKDNVQMYILGESSIPLISI